MITILLQILIAIIVIGLIMWLLTAIPGLDPTIVQIGRVVCVVIFVIFVIYILMGLMGGGHPALR